MRWRAAVKRARSTALARGRGGERCSDGESEISSPPESNDSGGAGRKSIASRKATRSGGGDPEQFIGIERLFHRVNAAPRFACRLAAP